MFAPYVVSRELGRGTHGLVLQARGPDGRDVAIKLLMAPSPERRQRFDRERKTMAQLDETAGFVPLLGVLETAQGPCLIMPFYAGGTLRDRLRTGPLRIHEGIRVGRKLAAAMGRAHALSIVHRDLKPENVLFGATGEPLIADLGLAKHWGESMGVTNSLSRSGELRGTAGYMAPEQAADAKSAGPAADVFSLGAIIYELLAGEAPFRGEGQLEVLARSRRGEFEPLASVNAEVPAWLSDLVGRCLAADPAKRFEDGAALSIALLQGSTRRHEARRGPLLIGAAVAVAVVAGIAVFAATRPQDPATAGPVAVVPPTTTTATAPMPPPVATEVEVTTEAPVVEPPPPELVVESIGGPSPKLVAGSMGVLETLVKLGPEGDWMVSRPDGRDVIWENTTNGAAARYLYTVFRTTEPRRLMVDVTVEQLDPKLAPLGGGIIYDFDPQAQSYFAMVLDAKDKVTLYRRERGTFTPQWSRQLAGGRTPARRVLEVVEEQQGFEIVADGERLMELSRKPGHRIGGGGVGIIVMGAGRFTFHAFDAPLKQ